MSDFAKNSTRDLIDQQLDGAPVWIVQLLSVPNLLPFAFRRAFCKYVAVDLPAFFCRNHTNDNNSPVSSKKLLVPRGAAAIQGLSEQLAAGQWWRCKTEFTFLDEAGTGEGPTQEFYSELSAILNHSDSPWHQDQGIKIGGMFPSCIVASPEFTVLGSSIARSFCDGFLLDVQLHPQFWSLIRSDEAVSFEEVDPVMHHSLQKLAIMNDAELLRLGLFLDEEGRIPLQCCNLSRFVSQTIEASLRIVKENAKVLRRYFESILPIRIFQIFSLNEMNAVFCGVKLNSDGRYFSESDLRAVVVGAHGYSNDSSEVQSFVRVVGSKLSVQEQEYFLEFLTGCSRLPCDGLRGLGKPITVVRKDMEDRMEGTLPSCNTCFLYVKFPPYKTEAVMWQRTVLAISEGRKNFSLS